MAYTTQYIGSRYVPQFADPAEWNNTRTYEPLTIVLNEGNSYTSRQFVPMGIEITNENFWLETGNYNAQVEAYRQEVLTFTQNVNPVFTTAKEMQQASNLRIGSIVHTLGFNAIDDYGAGIYIITETGTSNGMDILACKNCIATLVITGTFVTPEMFGFIKGSCNDASPYFTRIMHDLGIGNIALHNTYLIAHTVFYNYGLSIHMFSPNHKGCLKNGLTNIVRNTSDYYVIKDFQTCFSNRTNADSEISYTEKPRTWADYFILDGIEIDMNAKAVSLNAESIQYGGCSQMFYTFLYKRVKITNCYIHDSILTPFIIRGVGFTEITNNHGENISTYDNQYKTGVETENVFEISRVWLDILNTPNTNTVHPNYLSGFISIHISNNSFNVRDALGNIGSFNLVNIENDYIYNYTGNAHECTCYKAELMSYTFNRNISEIDTYGFAVNVSNCKVLDGSGMVATTEGYADAEVTLLITNCTAISTSADTLNQIYMPVQTNSNTVAKISNTIAINSTLHSFSQNSKGDITYSNCVFTGGEIAYIDASDSNSSIQFCNCAFTKNNPINDYTFLYLNGWNKVLITNCTFEDNTNQNIFTYVYTAAEEVKIIDSDFQAHKSTGGCALDKITNVMLSNSKFSNTIDYALLINTGSAGVGSKVINLNTIAQSLINNESFASIAPNSTVITPLF